LRLGERLDSVIEVVAGPPNGAGVSVDGFRLQPLELERIRLDRESGANHDLNRLLDEPGLGASGR
jgi:hypothetical protein